MKVENIPIDQLKVHRWHDKLPESLKPTIRLLFSVVGKHMEPNYQKWEDGFCFDLHPEREASVWCRIAGAWLRFVREHPQEATIEPGKKIALIAVASTGSDIGHRPFGKELLDCLKDPKIEEAL
jgi:hypothetical protein